jgi:cysteinyl-tRNA synthetase
VLVSAHYRQKLNFTFHAMDAARAALARIDDCRERLENLAASGGAGAVPEWAAAADAAFKSAMSDDLNTPEALAAVFGFVHEANRAMDAGSLAPAHAAGAVEVLNGWDAVLAVLAPEGAGIPAAVLELAERRQSARSERRWKDADTLRGRIAELGWEVKDTREGPKLRKL